MSAYFGGVTAHPREAFNRSTHKLGMLSDPVFTSFFITMGGFKVHETVYQFVTVEHHNRPYVQVKVWELRLMCSKEFSLYELGVEGPRPK